MILRERSFDCTFDKFTTLLGMRCHSVVDCVILLLLLYMSGVLIVLVRKNSIFVPRTTWGGQRSVSTEDWYLRSRWTFSRLLQYRSALETRSVHSMTRKGSELLSM